MRKRGCQLQILRLATRTPNPANGFGQRDRSKMVLPRLKRQQAITLIELLVVLAANFTTSVRAGLNPKEQLIDFVMSRPPIRQMVVESIWYGRDDTNNLWMLLCWQTNAYVLRTAYKRVGLFDKFTLDKDDVIAVRSNDIYSVVSYYKLLGVHVRQVHGLRTHPNEKNQDIVTPMIVGQQERVSIALAAGIPFLSHRAILRSNDTLITHDESGQSNATITVEVGDNNLVQSLRWTNEVQMRGTNPPRSFHGHIYYKYARDLSPAWFPHEIIRDIVIGGRPRPLVRLIVHRLELGVVPLSEFFPERFLPGPPTGRVFTSNGLSFVARKFQDGCEEVKPVSQFSGTSAPQVDLRQRTAIRLAIGLAIFIMPTILIAVHMQKRLRH